MSNDLDTTKSSWTHADEDTYIAVCPLMILPPTPAYRSLSAGLSTPVKFSNRYKGDIKAATFSMQQAEVQYQQVVQQIQVEVTQAFINYQAAQKQVQQFDNGMLTDAKEVLEGKIYSYKRGETSLLEVLNAQRTYNDVQQIITRRC
ncbi:MAG: hypothetical protein DI535_29790 [Citrobacter freundii]|jgi:cobalt-zinc-cadmium efflux system outer membrane protein|nr:hypothetical protein DC498_21450 [Terrimonas sp.]PZR20551.1 MAG: hypothetical protein DI535_29790 [Citrobacter freundii]